MPWLAEFPGDPLKCKKMISNADKINEFIDDIVDEHVNNFDENDIEDLTSAYIKEMQTKESSGKKTTMSCNFIYTNLPFLLDVTCRMIIIHVYWPSVGSRY